MKAHHKNWIKAITFTAFLVLTGVTLAPAQSNNAELLKSREAVWRAWFANDTSALKELVPSDTIVIDAGEEKWKNQSDIFQEAAQFQASGGKLIRLEFPRTEVQHFGNVAVTYSQYLYEMEQNGKRTVTTGRVTEVFELRHGKWTNPGWHTDFGK